MVAFKVSVVFFVIFFGIRYVNVANWTNDFAPYGYGGMTLFGYPVLGGTDRGMLAGGGRHYLRLSRLRCRFPRKPKKQRIRDV